MKSILRLPVACLVRAAFARSSALRHLLIFALHALALPAVAQSRGFFLPAGLYADEGSYSPEVTVKREGGPELPAASVELMTADGTAKAGKDYTAVKTTVRFAAGQTQQSVEIPLLDDTLVEGLENFTLTLQNPAGGTSLDPQNTTPIYIIDDDHGFVVRGVASSYGWVAENQPAAHFEVAIVGDFTLAETAAVTVSTKDGTAKAGTDYQATTARLVFAPGERVKSFTVPILNDALAEGNETFFIELSQSVGAPISYNTFESKFSATIVDNELGYRLSESANPGQEQLGYYVFREGTTTAMNVWRDGDFDITSTARLSFAKHSDYFGEEGTAAPGADFPTNSLLVTFGPGETRKTVTFDLPDDGVNESEALFFLTLEPVGGTVPVQQHHVHRAYILDSGVFPALVDPDFDLTTSPVVDTDSRGLRWVAQPDGKLIYVADRLLHDGHSGSVILRVLPNGQSDPAWSPATLDSPVTALALEPGGALLVAQQENSLVRLRADGSRDASFHEPTLQGYTLSSLLVDPEGRILAADPQNQTVWRLRGNGLLDLSFIPPVLDDSPRSIQWDADGKLLVFVDYGLVRLKADGTRELGFISPADPVSGDPYSDIRSVLALADGKLLVIARSQIDGQMTVIRLRSDGTTDPGFVPQRVGDYSLLVATSGSAVWLLRDSSYFNPIGWFVERLLPDGDRDPDWAGQQILVPKGRGDGDERPIPRFVPLPNEGLLVVNSQIVNGQSRHRAAKLEVSSGLRVVVDPVTARISENAGNASLQLLRSGSIKFALTLGWATEPITAKPGEDYRSVSGTVTFLAGQRVAAITVPVLDNDLPDRDRLVRLRFTATPGTPVPPPAGFVIVNDELGFPPDGIRALADGSVLLRPTGWLGAMRLQGGSLEDLQNGNYAMEYRFREPYPEIFVTPDDSVGPIFFRVVNPNVAP
jgi:hypothetical protein